MANGKLERVRKALPSKREAEKYEHSVRQALMDGTFSRKEVEQEKKTEVPTLGKFADEFLETYVKNNNKPSEQAAKRSMITHHIKPLLGDVPLDEVGRQIEWFKAQLGNRDCAGGQATGNGKRKRKRKLGKKRINNILALLSKMLRFAADDLTLIPDAPKVRLLKLPKGDHDFLLFDEYDMLVEAARQEPQWHAAILAAGDAGLRQGEIMGLEWPDLDFDERLMTVRRTIWNGLAGTPKGGRDRVIPMTERLREALSGLPRHLRTIRVFYSPDGSSWNSGKMQRPLWRACRRAGIRRISWHTLRHTYCSHLGMLGAAPVAIQAAAGHESLATTKRYIHVAADVLRDTIRKLDQRVSGGVGAK
jgi:integrase